MTRKELNKFSFQKNVKAATKRLLPGLVSNVFCASSDVCFAFSDKIVSNGSLTFEAAKMLQTKGDDEDSFADAAAVVVAVDVAAVESGLSETEE